MQGFLLYFTVWFYRNTYDVLEAELYFENALVLIQFTNKQSVQSNTANERTYKNTE